MITPGTTRKAPLEEGVSLAAGYEIIEHLYRSNDYDVYHVWSEERYCGCIAKTLRPDRLDRDSVQERLLREGERLENLSHPNLVRAYGVIREPRPVVILETLTGRTLESLIAARRKKRLPATQIVHLGLQLCSAVRYLQRNDLLHLDIKPSNIVAQPPLAKVMDLSIARPPGERRKGAGTRRYMTPEQARDDELAPVTDAWGIGATLYEAATGDAPFAAYEGEDRYDQLERRANPVRSIRRLPAALAKVIDGCLEPEPDRRPEIDEVFRTLARPLDGPG